MKRLDIAMVNQFYHPITVGGAEVSVKDLAEGLAEKGHSVHVATTQPGGLPGEEQINGVHVHRLDLPNVYTWNPKVRRPAPLRLAWHLVDSWNIWMLARFKQWLRQVKPEVLHTNTISGFSPSIWKAARTLEIPIVHTLRDFYLRCLNTSMYRPKQGECRSRCVGCRWITVPRAQATTGVQAVVGISRFVLQSHLDAGLFHGVSRQIVIHNSFNSKAVKPERSGGAVGGLRLGFLGRVHPNKGVEWLLDILARHQSADVSLKIAGTGDDDYVADLRKRYASRAVEFLGFRRPEELLSGVDFLVVPSLWQEPLGRVVFEAYAHGVPVIVSNRGGAPEMVEIGKTGLIFDPDKPETFLGILDLLKASPSLRDDLARGASAKAQEFSRETIARKYEELLFDLARS